jgi:DNA-binding MarR family transcriptional regulator
MSRSSDVVAIHESFVGLVRALGLLRPDTTPCGQPMSITEAHAIGELEDAGPLTQRALAERLRLQKSTVSRLIDQLETAGTVRRTPNPADGRSVLIALTAPGRRRAGRLNAARIELFGQLLDQLPASEHRRVIAALRHLEEAARALP